MTGMSRNTGRSLATDTAHILQSISDIVGTPLGSRVMRRTYGSLIFRLIDQPTNGALLVKLYAAIVTAITTWEDRIQITVIEAELPRAGALTLTLTGVIKATGGTFRDSVAISLGGIA